MILYTPLCKEDIFNNNEINVERKIVTYYGRTVQVEETSDGSYTLHQLLSTDPQDFLMDQLTPGSKILNVNNYHLNDQNML